ncbi:MAG: nickel-responsive transcriptional regulator NikR [Thermoplasmata archaeon]|nr:nickel-responsive transcriptional regulator NikR [Thermoplasmata archaeon]
MTARRRKAPGTGGVVRTAISLEPEVLAALDRWVEQRNSRSRSDAIRFLVRGATSAASLGDPDADAVGTVMVLYDHRSPYVQRRLTAAQHRWGDHIRSSSHVHLEGDVCLEVMILAGQRREVERAAEDLRGVKGVSQGDFLVASPGTAGGRSGHHHPHGHPPAHRRAVPSRGA